MAIGDRYIARQAGFEDVRGTLYIIRKYANKTTYELQDEKTNMLVTFDKRVCKKLVKRDKFNTGWNAALDHIANYTHEYLQGASTLHDWLLNHKRGK